MSQPRSGGAYSHTSSAPASDGRERVRCTPMRMVFERGSSTAMMRAVADALAQPIEGRGDCGGMVREVVVDAHAADLAAQLHAARDAREAAERLDRRAAPRPRRGAPRRSPRAHSPCCARRSATTPPCRARCRPRAPRSARSPPLRRRPRSTAPRAAPRARSPRSGVQQPMASVCAQPLVVGVPDDAAAAGHDAHQVMELALDGGDVRVDVGVIELEVVEDHACAAGSARTWRACRRRRCRTRRPR